MRAQVTMLLLVVALVSCKKAAVKEPPLIVREDPATAVTKANEIRKNTPPSLRGTYAHPMGIGLISTNPVAMSIDDAGPIPHRTNRQKNSEFDIRAIVIG